VVMRARWREGTVAGGRDSAGGGAPATMDPASHACAGGACQDSHAGCQAGRRNITGMPAAPG
jgi:hypothetical protein